MSEQQTDLAKEFGELFQKTAEANKVFLTEGAKFVSQLTSGKVPGDKLASLQNGLLTDAFTTYVRLGLQYTSNLVDLGLAFTKRLNEELTPKENNVTSKEDSSIEKPAFVLKATGTVGSIATTEFLLDSDKNEPIFCELKQTEYSFQDQPEIKKEFQTSFVPQSFQLLPGQPQKVEISIRIPADTAAGIYSSQMQVKGFEHIFFSLYLQVKNQPNPNISAS
jgi:hypothetical protein